MGHVPQVTAIYARIKRETVSYTLETIFKPRNKNEPGTNQGICAECGCELYYKKNDCPDLEKIYELACSSDCVKKRDWKNKFPGIKLPHKIYNTRNNLPELKGK